ncbi:MAG: hypothetical protein JW706_09775 [Opitutales bacterium]|nr:hypothetical protein [Opitutales bacterium]
MRPIYLTLFFVVLVSFVVRNIFFQKHLLDRHEPFDEAHDQDHPAITASDVDHEKIDYQRSPGLAH